MSSARKFKRGFLDGFYEIFQNDPYIVKMSGRTQQKEENGEDTLDKRTLSVFVARKIRDNYMDVCASLPWVRVKEPAKFILEYLKNTEKSAFFERVRQVSLLNTVFETVTKKTDVVAARELFDIILENISERETSWTLPYEPAKNRQSTKGFIQALGELRAVSPKYEVRSDGVIRETDLISEETERRGDKYALLTEIKKNLKRIEKELDEPALNDFSNERFIVSRTLELCFREEGYGKAFWKQWFDILCFQIKEEALQIAVTEAFIDLSIVNLFKQKQIEAKYRNMGDGRDLSQKPQTKNVFAQDVTFKDVCETYYIQRFLLSMNDEQSDNQERDFETLLRYHAAYISTASTSRFPAETGRLFSGTTSATGKNTQRTKQLLAIFAFFYFYSTFRQDGNKETALENFRKFNGAARITVDEKNIFNDSDVFAIGFDVGQRKYLKDIHDCINAVQRDFLYIFEKTQKVINSPTRDQIQYETPGRSGKTVAQYMKSLANKLNALCGKEVPREGDIALLKKNAENIVRNCENIDLHIPDILVEEAMTTTLENEKKKEQGKLDKDISEKPETIAQYFMNECLKNLEEKFNEAAEKDFLCNQLLLRQDFASVRMLLFRFARYNDFTNECILDIDLLQMRNELLDNIDDILLVGDKTSKASKYSQTMESLTGDTQYSLTVADEIFRRTTTNDEIFQTSLSRNSIEVKADEALAGTFLRISEQVKTPILEKNSGNSYRFICDLNRLILAGVGFARKYDRDDHIGDEFIKTFDLGEKGYSEEHLDYYFDPFILFGTIVVSYLSSDTRKILIQDLCQRVRNNSHPDKRLLQEGCILLLNNVLLQTHILLSYYERKAIFDCIFATNMYPKQWQAYEILKTRSFYAEYAEKEFQCFLEGIVSSPRFIYLAASTAPELPGEKWNSGDIKFDFDGKTYTPDDYYYFCLRLQYLTWTKNKHSFKAEQIAQIVNLGCEVAADILEKDDIDKRKFALGTQMLLVGVANLIRSNRLTSADSKKNPYHVFHENMVRIMIRSEYLQRTMNKDYQDYLKLTPNSMENIPTPDFWMLCGGLRYVAAIWKEYTDIPNFKVKLTKEEAEGLSHSLNTLAAKWLTRFYTMDHRLIYWFTDYFDQNKGEWQRTLDLFGTYDENSYLNYDHMERYAALMTKEKYELAEKSKS